jgi:hypothetical protein
MLALSYSVYETRVNPLVLSYNASVVENYNGSSLVRPEKNYIKKPLYTTATLALYV